MGERADFLLQGRVQIVKYEPIAEGSLILSDHNSAWRPISVVENWPLALCDGSSIHYEDLLEVDLIRKEYIGATMYAKYRPGYKWYYVEQQTADEVCLFKNFDSDGSVKAPSRFLI